MGWRTLYRLEAIGLDDTVRGLTARVRESMGGRETGEWTASVEPHFRRAEPAKAATRPRTGVKASPDMFRIRFSDPPGSEYFVFQKESVVEAGLGIEKIFDDLKMTKAKQERKIQGESFRISDFVVRIGLLSAAGIRNRSIILELDYLSCHTDEAKDILHEFAISLLQPFLTSRRTDTSEQPKTGLSKASQAKVDFKELGIMSPKFTHSHRAALYAQLMLQENTPSSANQVGPERVRSGVSTSSSIPSGISSKTSVSKTSNKSIAKGHAKGSSKAGHKGSLKASGVKGGGKSGGKSGGKGGGKGAGKSTSKSSKSSSKTKSKR